MMSETNFKLKLQQLIDQEFKVASNVELDELLSQLMDNIGTPIFELREQVYLVLTGLIAADELSDEQLKHLLNKCLRPTHLFYGLGKTNDDAVFTRSFTMLVIREIIALNNKKAQAFLNESDIKHVLSEVLTYYPLEMDTRGYAGASGWAHATAHAADTFGYLAQSPKVGLEDLLVMLNAIKEKFSTMGTPYSYEEDERTVNAILCILNREEMTFESFSIWVDGFAPVTFNHTDMASYVRLYHRRLNQKNMLRSLYFKLKGNHKYQQHVDLIAQVLTRHNHH